MKSFVFFSLLKTWLCVTLYFFNTGFPLFFNVVIPPLLGVFNVVNIPVLSTKVPRVWAKLLKCMTSVSLAALKHEHRKG